MPDLTVVIPNFNGKHLLKECFDSLKNQNSSFDVIIIDNGSHDSSVRYIKNKYPEFTLIKNKKNMGFAIAVNQGIKASNTDFVFLLNNDVVLEVNSNKFVIAMETIYDAIERFEIIATK